MNYQPDLQILSAELDELVARMRTAQARAAARALFTATPTQLGEAAVDAMKQRDR